MSIKSLLLLFGLLAYASAATAQTSYNEISLPELMKKKKAGTDLVIIDVRTPGEYHDSASRNKQLNIGRIKGAINIPLQELQKDPEALKQLDAYRDRDIYLICSHSYRSRSASRILLNNGYKHVNNVQGGMTEWYRRFDELSGYRKPFLETSVHYYNISPAEALRDLASGANVKFIGVRTKPQFWYDTFNLKLYRYLPLLKQMRFVDYSDSLQLLNEWKGYTGKLIFFNLVNNGAAELAEWLRSRGINGTAYLVGGLNLLYEYGVNQYPQKAISKWFREQSRVNFITPMGYCGQMNTPNVQLIDLRPDSVFNKINPGVKHDFRHLKNSLNFSSDRGPAAFEQAFPDRTRRYVFISDNVDGLSLAAELAEKGYRISWLLGGIDRWEWYMNNTASFRCNDSLVDR